MIRPMKNRVILSLASTYALATDIAALYNCAA